MFFVENKLNIFIFSILVIFFTVLLFLGELFFFGTVERSEEDFLEISVYESGIDKKENFITLTDAILGKKTAKPNEIKRQKILKEIKRLKEIEEKKSNTINLIENQEVNVSSQNVVYSYIPENFISRISSKEEDFDNIFKGKMFGDFIKKITLSFYEERPDVRGKMKNKTIKLFDPNEMEEDELLGIFIHEFSHYIDLYHLERIEGADVSNQFYDISWYSTIIMNAGLNQKDFVSGYSMTNKYEDFAESLTYYIFHNDDFVEKMKNSEILTEKYNFIKNAIFQDESFIGTDFSLNNEIELYYRDITKIDFSKKNFLQYVKKSI